MYLSTNDHYIVLLDFKFQKKYILWFSSDDVDGVVVNSEKKIIGFKDKTQLLKFVEENTISLKEDITAYNINYLQQWIINPNRSIDCEEVLNFWNLCIDISDSTAIEFLGNVKDDLRNGLYNKLFDVAGPFIVENTDTDFNDTEIVKLSEIIQDGLTLLIENLAVTQ